VHEIEGSDFKLSNLAPDNSVIIILYQRVNHDCCFTYRCYLGSAVYLIGIWVYSIIIRFSVSSNQLEEYPTPIKKKKKGKTLYVAFAGS
jgi:hypothetical protein